VQLEKTVVIIGSEIWTQQRVGGVSRYIFELARNLAKHVEVIVLDVDNENHYFRALSKNSSVKILNRKIVESMVLEGSSSSNFIYQSSYYDSDEIKFWSSLGAKTVTTVHDLIAIKFPDRKSLRNPNNHQVESILQSDYLISVSKNTEIDLIELLQIPANSIRVIYHGVGLEETSLIDSSFPGHLPLKYFLFVGKRSKYKNFFRFLLAYLLSGQARNGYGLVIFGGERIKFYEKVLVGLFIPKLLFAHIDGDDSSLAYTYRHAVALCYPSLYEGFGFPPLEAMNARIPVLASAGSSIAEVCREFPFYFKPTSIISIIQALNLFNRSLPIPAQRIDNAFTYACGFTWDKCASETLNYYRSIIHQVASND
jgi:glycosyltransferase involved in cell wall biosynthesis